MTSKESDESKDKPRAGGPATVEQPMDAEKVSAELSMPKHVVQDPSAPEVSGYVLCDLLGSGAYGQVWRAWQLRTRKEVAVKVFMRRSGLDWIFLKREVERLAQLDRHARIVTLLDIGLDEEPPYYAMDFIVGGTLEQFVSSHSRVDNTRAADWMGQICDALSYVHGKGLIHCDLKPANILVDGRGQIRVVDFGQSRVFTESAASLGTLFYMAPEQATLSEPGLLVQPDVRWDVYALGASIYSILTGRVAYATPDNVASLECAATLEERLARYREMVEVGRRPDWNGQGRATLDYELVAIADKCMALLPDDRYSSVTEIEQDLTAMRERRPISPLAGRVSYRSKKFLKRNPVPIVLALALVALAATLVSASIRKAQLDRATAARLIASFVYDPAEAVAQVRKESPRVRRHVGELAGQYVASSAFTDRIMGVRAGLCVDRTAFWKSIVNGRLWDQGEWLELIDAFDAIGVDALDTEGARSIVDELDTKLTNGSPREKYVALCLLGQLLPEREGLAERCASLVKSEMEPGVVLAAAWAAERLGQDVQLASTDRVFVDDLTGMVFVAIPPTHGFRRGSDPSEPDRFSDEDREEGVDIGPVFMATTEVMKGPFARFFTSVMVGSAKTVAEKAELMVIKEQYEGMDPDDAMRVAMGGMSLNTARRFCKWLNVQAKGTTPSRTYRLPSEEEWEYAARAGNHTGRFCFGDSAEYARYFAHCDGSIEPHHVVAERMPNFYGLSDMHGGLSEMTNSIYPADLADPKHRGETLFVMRGGSWYSPAVRCRSAQRNYLSADYFDSRMGIRLVLEVAK